MFLSMVKLVGLHFFLGGGGNFFTQHSCVCGCVVFKVNGSKRGPIQSLPYKIKHLEASVEIWRYIN